MQSGRVVREESRGEFLVSEGEAEGGTPSAYVGRVEEERADVGAARTVAVTYERGGGGVVATSNDPILAVDGDGWQRREERRMHY